MPGPNSHPATISNHNINYILMAERYSSSVEDNDGPVGKDNNNSNKGIVDPQLWHACAGSQVQLPSVGSSVIYFPQGHGEHAALPPDFPLGCQKSSFFCRVLSVKFLADRETDEVFARVRLQPENPNTDCSSTMEDSASPPHSASNTGKIVSFAKTLTQSDANNGGGFSVPRYCAETIFPRLDYNEDPPVQIVLAKDVHGKVWKFRHIYRGTPRRHLLTTGWSNFVNHKKLVAGDAIVFLRSAGGELCVGVRRSTKGNGGGGDLSSACSSWHQLASASISATRSLSRGSNVVDNSYNFMDNGSGIPHFSRPRPDMLTSSTSFARNQARISPESVVEAVTLAASGDIFEVVYYPRATISEFFVKANTVRSSLQQRWTPGLRFKMAVETEDASRVSWFVGSVSKVEEVDPLRWPNSPWKILQVTWDEPDLLQGINRVSPWQVEIVSPIQLPPISFLKKKLKFSQPSEVQFDGQTLSDLSMPSLANDIRRPSKSWQHRSIDCVPTSMQGTRQNQHQHQHQHQHQLQHQHQHQNQNQNYGLSMPQPTKCQQTRSLLNAFYQQRDVSAVNIGVPDELYERDFFCQRSSPSIQSELSTSLVVGNTSYSQPTSVVSFNGDGSPGAKKATFVLFGKTIDASDSGRFELSGGNKSPDSISHNAVSDRKGVEIYNNKISIASSQVGMLLSAEKQPFFCSQTQGTQSNHCKVYNESDDVGWSVDLSSFTCFEELYERLELMFGADKYQFLNRLVYLDSMGFPRSVGEEPYWDFSRNVRRLKILSESSSESATKSD